MVIHEVLEDEPCDVEDEEEGERGLGAVHHEVHVAQVEAGGGGPDLQHLHHLHGDKHDGLVQVDQGGDHAPRGVQGEPIQEDSVDISIDLDIRGVDIIYYLPVYPCSGGAQLGGGGEVPGEDGGGGDVGGGHGEQDEAGHTHQLVLIVGSAEM